jgi:hypothetical protein
MEKAVAHYKDPSNYPLSDDPRSLESVFLRRFKYLPEWKREIAVKKTMDWLVNDRTGTRDRYYRRFADFDLRSPRPLESQIGNRRLTEGLDFSRSIGAVVRDERLPRPYRLGSRFDLEALVRYDDSDAEEVTNKLEFRIHKVKCWDETDGFLGTEAGTDEIKMGGNTTDATGTTRPLSAFRVEKEFEDGVVKHYPTPKVLVDFDLSQGEEWPKTYFVMLVLAEEDMGGLGDFLSELLDSVASAVANAIAEGIGLTVSALAGAIAAAIILAVVYFIVLGIFELIKTIWEDDVFEPFLQDIEVPSYNLRWAGYTESPQAQAEFIGHGGKYGVYYSWRIHS